MIYPWEAPRGDKAASASASKPGRLRRDRPVKASLPQVSSQSRTASKWKRASDWAAARKASASNVTQHIPTGASPPTATPATAVTAQPTVQPQAPQRVNGKVPENDDGFLVKLGAQAGFRGRWYCGRLLDPSDVSGACSQCGPEGGPQCNSCARFQSVYEPDLNDDGFPVKRSTSITYCYLFYCGRTGVVAGTGGPCGPHEGPQCPSCQRLQESFKAYNVNDEGCTVLRGSGEGYRGQYYCGRVLGIKAIPGSDGRCGPVDGPQCLSCQRFQKCQQIVIDEEPKPRAAAATRPAAVTVAKVKEEPAAVPSTATAEPLVQRSGASSQTDIANDEGCKLTRGTREGYDQTFYCGRKLGTAAIPGSPSGKCGPDGGPQCPACRRYQMGLEVDVNDDGVLVKVGTVHGFTNTYFCGRRFTEDKTKTTFRCGPADGPQCSSCRRFQMLRRRKAKDGQPMRVKQESETLQPTIEEQLRLKSQQKRKQQEAKPAKAKAKAKAKAVPQEVAKPVQQLVLCTVCGEGDREAELLLCDKFCGRATHLGCCSPPLAALPEGEWFCSYCSKPPPKKARVSPASPSPMPTTSRKVPSATPYPTVPGQLICTVCKSGERAAELLLCDTPGCDAATHMRCCRPALDAVPDGEWFCMECDPPTPQAKRKRQAKPKATARREGGAITAASPSYMAKGKGRGQQGAPPDSDLGETFKAAMAAAVQKAQANPPVGVARSLE